MPWTAEQILALAPDASSAKSGKDLSVPRKWLTLGATAECAWGTMQGSGKNPYQTSIDLAEPAFKCSCPSRKFPCKHSLGLFLVLAQQPGALTETNPPAWTTEWLSKRNEKAEKKAAKAAQPEAPPDPEAQAKAAAATEKRAASREAKVNAGLEEFSTWATDMVRTGLANLPGKPGSYWETPAARLVDAQAPGLARRVRALESVSLSGEGWPERILRELSLLHLVREGWSRMETLPPEQQQDVRAVLGFTENREELQAQQGVSDRWMVLGQKVEEDDRIRTQRVWLWGQKNNRPALVLSFSAGPNQPFDTSLLVGTAVEAELAYYPGASPLRALVKQRGKEATQLEGTSVTFPHAHIAAANQFAAEAYTANPWMERIPFGLAAVVPLFDGHAWLVRDTAGHALPLRVSDAQGWKLRVLSGGHPVALFGEWNGMELTPLSVWAEGRFMRV